MTDQEYKKECKIAKREFELELDRFRLDFLYSYYPHLSDYLAEKNPVSSINAILLEDIFGGK